MSFTVLRNLLPRLPAAVLLVAMLLAVQVPGVSSVSAQDTPRAGTITEAEWSAYTARFVTADGRVLDDGNGGISHSESQGYGLLLAYLADDEAAFDRIWTFTKTNLWLRDDGLVAWKWDPSARPHVTDLNNATDGDILIAYALILAGRAWTRPDFTEAGARISQAMENSVLLEKDGQWYVWPAVDGFGQGDQPDGPVVNLSYWVFEALPVLAAESGDDRWLSLQESGLRLVQQARFGPKALPSDWISIKGAAAPAADFPPEFSYNAIRIPLYLVRGGQVSPPLLLPYLNALGAAKDALPLVDVETGEVVQRLTDPGYVAIAAALECVLEGTPLPGSLAEFEPTLYYPSTLHLLVLSLLADQYPRCR